MRQRSETGFSLVEALVALAVFAMAGVALVQMQSQSLSAFSRVETRALADLAAQNRLTEIVASRERPGVGAREEDVEFAGRAWRMSVAIADTSDAQTRRASVSVGPVGAPPIATAHGFFSVRSTAPVAAETP